MKDWLKKVTGLKQLEEEKERLVVEAALAKTRAEAAKKEEELAKMTPKERATARGEPYIAVLETHVNKEFVLQLRQAGYGLEGDPDEEVVDRWFRVLCKDVAGEEGVDMTERGAGYINVKKIAEGRSEVS